MRTGRRCGAEASAAGRSAAGFANAVLRRVSERTPEEWDERLAAAARSDDERLAVRYAHPVWVIRAFRRALAAEGRADELETLLAADNEPPVVTFAALPGLAERPAEAAATPYSPIGFRSAGGDPGAVVAASEALLKVTGHPVADRITIRVRQVVLPAARRACGDLEDKVAVTYTADLVP